MNGTFKIIFSNLLNNNLNKESLYELCISFHSIKELSKIYILDLFTILKLCRSQKNDNAILVSTAPKKDIYRFDSFSMDM